MCGQDVFRVLALGARACLVGKAFLHGLAAFGTRGVLFAYTISRPELRPRWRSPVRAASRKSTAAG
jgi:isopentenyl diphosphate isomerase/L-lactate dehydrogenase-like FMN-dependent dehydrogenase